MENHPPFKDEMDFLEQCADTDYIKWVWPDEDKEEWSETRSYQKFYESWHNKTRDSEFLNKFPYKLSFGVTSRGKSLAPYCPDPAGGQILVTKAYDDMFHRLLGLRMEDRGHRRGAVITGQSGTGKTVFLSYMLARLISARQVVLWYNNYRAYLFFRGQVYTRMGASGFMDLPQYQGSYCPVWALIDVDFLAQGPPLSGYSDCWPIQASPPQSILWKSWVKRCYAALLGMPPWNFEELMEGLCLQPDYNDLRSQVEHSLSPLDGSKPPVVGYRSARATLKVLQGERNRDEMGNSIGAVANQDENMIDEAGRLQDKVDNAIKALVHNTIEEFGFAPRDVYRGISDHPRTSHDHARAIRRFDHSRLEILIQTFCPDHELDDFSERVVVMSPRPFVTGKDGWVIDFKSVQIGREVMEFMRLKDGKHLRKLYEYLREIREASPLAEWVLEAIVRGMTAV